MTRVVFLISMGNWSVSQPRSGEPVLASTEPSMPKLKLKGRFNCHREYMKMLVWKNLKNLTLMPWRCHVHRSVQPVWCGWAQYSAWNDPVDHNASGNLWHSWHLKQGPDTLERQHMCLYGGSGPSIQYSIWWLRIYRSHTDVCRAPWALAQSETDTLTQSSLCILIKETQLWNHMDRVQLFVHLWRHLLTAILKKLAMCLSSAATSVLWMERKPSLPPQNTGENRKKVSGWIPVCVCVWQAANTYFKVKPTYQSFQPPASWQFPGPS